MISRERIEELQKILKEDYGKNLDYKVVAGVASALTSYFDSLDKINRRSLLKNEHEANCKAPNKKERGVN